MLPVSSCLQVSAARRCAGVLFVIAAAALLATLAGASHQRQSPLPDSRRDFRAGPSLVELVERAETIVAGEVLELESSWTENRSTIFTTVTLRVDQRVKGAGQEVVRFRIPGGVVGDQAMLVTHSPRFSVGERSLVFLGRPKGLLPRVVGGQAGKRHIRVEEDGSQTIFPGFSLANSAAGTSENLNTLDELAVVVPRLAASASR